ncbi:HAD-IIB family hydrolase [Candidatus Kaiserbacteria bacterium]|nr:HAD-IIB family hydrolase [Candidatus Kaiserbacteria bacterium]
MPKHFFFDLDNTLTRSRNKITAEHAAILERLATKADVIVVTGGQKKQIQKQLGEALDGKYFILAQNGNHAETPQGELLWENTLTPEQKGAVLSLVEDMKRDLRLKVRDVDDLVEDRGSSICYSLIGHNEDIEKKEAFDPDHSKRRALLDRFKGSVNELRENHSVEIRSGGTTTLDCFEGGKNKGFNVKELIGREGWNTDDCIYVGDALFPGGNDETVIGIIPTRSVNDYNATYEYLSEVLK